MNSTPNDPNQSPHNSQPGQPKKKPVLLYIGTGAAALSIVVIILIVTLATVLTAVAGDTLPTKTPIPTATLTPTPIPAGSANADWVPVIQDFDGVEMVYVPAGCFMMGSTDEQIEAAFQQCEEEWGTGACDPAWFEGEAPAHEVCLDAFWIDRTEVTNAQYGSSGYFSGDNLPRERVTWFEARDFCESRGARLPTEAEWEYAARGPEGWIYPWGNEFDETRVNICDTNCGEDWHNAEYDDGYALTAPVGSYPDGASWVGALDLSGNVWEWVADWYSAEYYGTLADGVVNPPGPDSGDHRVLRSGSWDFFAYLVRAANRHWVFPDSRDLSSGFRCARSAEG
jgi:formylglycine-generating enzyme required for sulfatase activity